MACFLITLKFLLVCGVHFFFTSSFIQKLAKMATSSSTSLILATIFAVLVFSGMQIYKPWLSSSQLHTIFGGFMGSIFFILLMTACGNLETTLFGKSVQVKLFPEISSCLVLAVFCAGMIHRVSATTCILFSIISLYYINRYSQKLYSIPVSVPSVQTGKKRK